jgi:ABC-type Fe3+-siderophore transport system permease subunit
MNPRNKSPRKPLEFATFWREVRQNRPGFAGFVLSLVQLVLHGAWLGLAFFLAGSGKAEELNPSSPLAWLIVLLMLLGVLCTACALFLSLYGSLRGKPKVLALIGLALSFFVGTTTTFILLLSVLQSSSSP